MTGFCLKFKICLATLCTTTAWQADKLVGCLFPCMIDLNSICASNYEQIFKSVLYDGYCPIRWGIFKLDQVGLGKFFFNFKKSTICLATGTPKSVLFVFSWGNQMEQDNTFCFRKKVFIY